ncbi:MAG TPA: hypothetical protein VFI98_11115 [Pseudolabrys sp.]|jgi:hypothetical protein|nr:hypothetical protein [Pseudolabrys sp.]
MKLNVLALALAASVVGVIAANAQTVIEERHDPAIVIEHDHPGAPVTVEEHEALPGTEKKTITKETYGSGDCTSKTVHKEDEAGSKTIRKTNCD